MASTSAASSEPDRKKPTGNRQFFGQFLVIEGHVKQEQLSEALRVVKVRNLRLGEHCVVNGLLSRNDVRQIIKVQRSEDGQFGDIAVRLGLLTREQVDQVLEDQDRRAMRLGEALIELGHLSEESLSEHLDQFAAEQRTSAPLITASPAKLQRADIKLLMEKLPEALLRLTRVHIKVGDVADWSGDKSFPYVTRIGVVGDKAAYRFAIAGDHEFCAELARGMLQFDEDDDEDDLDDEVIRSVLSEASNMSAGALQRGLLDGDESLRIGLPEPQKFPSGGTIIELLAPRGRGALIVE